jgi:hypothetical protein
MADTLSQLSRDLLKRLLEGGLCSSFMSVGFTETVTWLSWSGVLGKFRKVSRQFKVTKPLIYKCLHLQICPHYRLV